MNHHARESMIAQRKGDQGDCVARRINHREHTNASSAETAIVVAIGRDVCS